MCVVTSYSWAYTFWVPVCFTWGFKGEAMKGNVPFQPSCWSLLFTQKAFFSVSLIFFSESYTFFYLKRTSFRSLFCPVYLNDDRLRNKKFAICSKPLQLNVYQEISTALKMLTHKIEIIWKTKNIAKNPFLKCLWFWIFTNRLEIGLPTQNNFHIIDW